MLLRMTFTMAMLIGFQVSLTSTACAQPAAPTLEAPAAPGDAAAPGGQSEPTPNPTGITIPSTEMVQEKVDEISRQVDRDPRAREVAAGILQPIYDVAEKLAFPAFHWLAFALMFAGVISYGLQLVLGKLVVLTRLGFSFSEILSDATGLVISLVGLVLTTQAAAENSSFTGSAAAVISAAVVGLVYGFLLYLWGQSQELQAVAGRSAAGQTPAANPPAPSMKK